MAGMFIEFLKQLGLASIGNVASQGFDLGNALLKRDVVDRKMSGKELQAFNLNAQEAQKAREWNAEQDSTKYQRTVADMQAAGVNPALAMQGGVTTQAGSNAVAQASTQSSSMPSGTNMLELIANLKNLQAQNENLNADTEKKRAEANAINTENTYREEYLSLRNEGMQYANKLTNAQERQVYKQMDEIEGRIDLMKKQATTEESKAFLNYAQAALADANAKQVIALTPVLVAYNEAKTEEARASAALMVVKAAGEQKLFEGGYFDSLLETAQMNANTARAHAIESTLHEARRTGDGNFYGQDDSVMGKARYTVMTRLYELCDLLGGTIGTMFNYNRGTSSEVSTSTSTSTSSGSYSVNR